MATASPLDFDPVAAALDRAERGIAMTPEQEAERARVIADHRARRHEMVPHEVVHARLEARLAQAEEIGARLRALGRDDTLLDSTPDEAQAYCDEVFGVGAVVILGSKDDPSAAAFLAPYRPA
jgi:hypothetical protein